MARNERKLGDEFALVDVLDFSFSADNSYGSHVRKAQVFDREDCGGWRSSYKVCPTEAQSAFQIAHGKNVAATGEVDMALCSRETSEYN